MIDDFFQQKQSSSSIGFPNTRWSILFRSLLYTSITGFILGSICGYLHIKGWIPTAEKGLILYSITFGIGAVLCTSFVLYQSRQNQLKAQKVKTTNLNR